MLFKKSIPIKVIWLITISIQQVHLEWLSQEQHHCLGLPTLLQVCYMSGCVHFQEYSCYDGKHPIT